MAVDVKAHHEFMKMLCRAAGVDQHKVTSISCSVEAGGPVMFQVGIRGEEMYIRRVLSTEPQQPPPSLDMGS